jgi:hypothetical protein
MPPPSPGTVAHVLLDGMGCSDATAHWMQVFRRRYSRGSEQAIIIGSDKLGGTDGAFSDGTDAGE